MRVLFLPKKDRGDPTSILSALWMKAMSKPTQTSADTKTAFEIFHDGIGHWCARRVDGLVLGTFFERDSAVHFARRECRDPSLLRLIFRTADSPSTALTRAV